MAKTNNLNPIGRIGGSSFFFNSIFIGINVLAVLFLVLGYHDSFESKSTIFKLIGYLCFGISLIGLILLKGRLLMNSFSRILVGGLFIVSGLVKANDPVGFSYKLEEYFEDGALAYRIKELFGSPEFSLEFFIQFALPISIFISVLEIVLGVYTLLGRHMKLVSLMLVSTMLFFTFLTWHTAACDGSKKFLDRDRYEANDPIALEKVNLAKTNKDIKIVSSNKSEIVIDESKQPQCVDDCGCFGDAMKGSVGRSLTPKESLWKDIVLTYFGIWILLASFKRGKTEQTANRVFVIGGILVIATFSWIFSWFFPIVFGGLALLGSLWFLGSLRKESSKNIAMIIWNIGLCALLISYVLSFDPIKDYRPYAAGTNLIEKMNDGQDGKYQSLLVYKNIKTGETREYDASSKEYTNSKIWEKADTWKYINMTQKEIVAMRIPSITEQFNPYLSAEQLTPIEMELPYVANFMKPSRVPGLKIWDKTYNSFMEIPMEEYSVDGFPAADYKIVDTVEVDGPSATEINLRDYIISEKQIFVLISKKLEEANWASIQKYKDILNLCKKKNIPMILLVSSSPERITAFRKKYNFKVPIFINDETELKAITRSNPALMIIEKGIVKAKYPHRSTPSAKWINENMIHK